MTAGAVRGQGVFGTLYAATEADNLRRNVNIFATFTNEMSTPIFLKKFGYARGQSRCVLWLPANPRRAVSPARVRRVARLDEEFFRQGVFQFDNAINKSYHYFLWRYLARDAGGYSILELDEGGRVPLGYVFLKRITKKGVPLYLCMDVALHRVEHLSSLLRAGVVFASRSLSAGVLLLENTTLKLKGLLRLKTNKQFNFLVKGITPEATQALAAIQFNFFWGDLDFA